MSSSNRQVAKSDFKSRFDSDTTVLSHRQYSTGVQSLLHSFQSEAEARQSLLVGVQGGADGRGRGV